MKNDKDHRLAGAQIFRDAIKYIQQNGWHHNSMDILLAVSSGGVWPQPMAVYMFSELSSELGSDTLSDFDRKTTDQNMVITLFTKIATNLESTD